MVGDFGDRAEGEVDGDVVTDEFIAVEVEVRGVAGHELGAEDFDEIVEPSEGLVVAARFGRGLERLERLERLSRDGERWGLGTPGAAEQVGELLLLLRR